MKILLSLLVVMLAASTVPSDARATCYTGAALYSTAQNWFTNWLTGYYGTGYSCSTAIAGGPVGSNCPPDGGRRRGCHQSVNPQPPDYWRVDLGDSCGPNTTMHSSVDWNWNGTWFWFCNYTCSCVGGNTQCSWDAC